MWLKKYTSLISLLTITIGLISAPGALADSVWVEDSLGTHKLPETPVRPVVLDWDLLEQVIELGITPVGATELESYADWVVQPAIPEKTQNVGTRGEPNLEKIASLDPDIILVTDTQKALIPQLKKLAPVLYYSNFSASDQHADIAIRQFKMLAGVFNRQDVAEHKLAFMQTRFDALRQKITASFHGQHPEILVMRFANTSSAFIYTDNSIPNYVLSELGLLPALPKHGEKWGISQILLTDLQVVDSGYVLYFLPFAEEKKLQKSVLWRVMPFVRKKHVNSVNPVWSYGGAMSLLYTAEAITESLLEVAPSS